MPGSLQVKKAGPIATVVLDRPGKLNALTRSLWAAVGAAFRDLEADDELRCIVLRGAGGNFAAGADITEFPALRTGVEQARAYGELMHETMAAIAGCRHPTVAVIEGACIGGGLELAICCDLRLAADTARFGVPIQKISVTMGWPEVGALVSVVGPAAAREILLEGRVFPAEEALRKGLVSRVVPADQLEAEAFACTQRIADGAPLVHRFHKRAIQAVAQLALPSQTERDGAYQTYASEDFREGVEAFLGKRKPSFRGR